MSTLYSKISYIAKKTILQGKMGKNAKKRMDYEKKYYE